MASGSSSADSFLQAHPELQFVDLLIPDMNGIVRGKRVDPSALAKVFERGVAMLARQTVSVCPLQIPSLWNPGRSGPLRNFC